MQDISVYTKQQSAH